LHEFIYVGALNSGVETTPDEFSAETNTKCTISHSYCNYGCHEPEFHRFTVFRHYNSCLFSSVAR
jgi:hypothetical protein